MIKYQNLFLTSSICRFLIVRPAISAVRLGAHKCCRKSVAVRVFAVGQERNSGEQGDESGVIFEKNVLMIYLRGNRPTHRTQRKAASVL